MKFLYLALSMIIVSSASAKYPTEEFSSCIVTHRSDFNRASLERPKEFKQEQKALFLSRAAAFLALNKEVEKNKGSRPGKKPVITNLKVQEDFGYKEIGDPIVTFAPNNQNYYQSCFAVKLTDEEGAKRAVCSNVFTMHNGKIDLKNDQCSGDDFDGSVKVPSSFVAYTPLKKIEIKGRGVCEMISPTTVKCPNGRTYMLTSEDLDLVVADSNTAINDTSRNIAKATVPLMLRDVDSSIPSTISR